MLSLERLRILWAISNHGSVSGAACGLHVTTSAISQQMAKLEREVGQRLLVKSGRGVRLTDAGWLLARHAKRMMSEMESAEADLAAHHGQAIGELAIGAFPTAARGLLPQMLACLAGGYPRLRVKLHEVEPETALPMLRRGDLDLAVTLDWSNKPLPLAEELLKDALLDDVADVALPSTHPLAGRRSLDLAELSGENWICWPEGEMCREWLVFTLRGKGIEPQITHTAGEHQTQLALVAAGLGVAVAPRLGRYPVPEGVTIVPLTESLRRHVYAVWRSDAERRPSIQAALAALRKVAGAAVVPASPAEDRISPRPESSAGC